MKHFYVLSYLSFFLFSACSERKQGPIQEVIIPVVKKIDIGREVSAIISDYLEEIDTNRIMVVTDDSLFASRLVFGFYLQNGHTSVWFNKEDVRSSCDSICRLIKQADTYGLIAGDYHVAKIDSLLNFITDKKADSIDVGALSKAELLLTDAFFTICVHVSKGRLSNDSLTREWKGEKLESINLPGLLELVLKNNRFKEVLDTLEPQNNEYQLLKAALSSFKIEFKDSDWDSLFYESVDSSAFEERLKKRLLASHDYYDIYDGNEKQKMITAIKNFQCRHHLVEDGKVGKLTYKALQKTKSDYIRQLEMNMERWRIYGKPNDEAYCWVNIPKFEMQVIEKDSLILRSNVIVGKPKNPTPILQSKIRYMVIYPYWNVPKKIAVKEILPILKRNPKYLINNNFEVLNARDRVVTEPIHWERYHENYFPFRLRQRIGDDNSLGILKFHFNNKYGVYLHDTNTKKWFSDENRALSHGCVRVEKFIDFALYLILPDSAKYTSNDFKYDILQERQKHVYFKRPLPIYINYFTSEVTNDGQIYFYPDIYGRDDKMIKSLSVN